ncbi:hypothetical protein D3C85_1067750 [compost metagenome]
MEDEGGHQGETGQQHREAAGKETQHDGETATQLQQDHQGQHEPGHAHGFHVTLGTGVTADLAPACHHEHQRQQNTTRQQCHIFHLVHRQIPLITHLGNNSVRANC